MRPSLLHPLRDPRRSRRSAHGRGAAKGKPSYEPVVAASDPAVQRVRAAGGPIDRASYACACGYLFSASVSTTVMCPHCGADQSW
jgi:hypothetical protein